jgi:hypothetical protein
MEEEARQNTKRTVSAPDRLGDMALRFFGPTNGVDLEAPTYEPHEPMDFIE